MAENRGFDILDGLIIIADRKYLFIFLFFFVLIISYLSIYFFVEDQFESRALIVTVDNSESSGGIGSLVKSFSSLPISIPGLNSGVDTDLFTTIIYSRTNLEKVINKFDLKSEYGRETMAETVKALANNLSAEENDQGAYQISIRDNSPQKAADIINYVVELLNDTLIDLNVAKSRDNRLFMEKRYDEIKSNLKSAEDSLVYYQKQSGILYAEDQVKSSFEAYTKLEADLAAKQIEYSVLSKLYDENAPQVKAAKISLDEYKNRLEKIKSGNENSELILALKNLPEKSMAYLRYYRDVEIYSSMLEFIIPLYEQTRFEEQKDIPVLQVIDKAVPADKKSFPPRTLLTLLITFFVMFVVAIFFFIKEFFAGTTNSKVNYLKDSFLLKKRQIN